jgi:uracil-DNA glycosylase
MILMPDKISEFVVDLGARPDTHGTSNPYRRIDCRLNLENYLRAMVARPGRRILVVAEALGYRGGGLTGIPISSENLLRLAPHPFLRALRESLQIDGNTSEATATMVWDTLAGRRRIPLFWNAFPFHPHRSDEPASNRAPTADEVAEGQEYLVRLADIYRPQVVAGLGGKGTAAAQRAFPGISIIQIRHPSYGGKSDCQRGMEQLLRR